MKNKRFVTGIVGILVGFILGFFVSQNLVQTPGGMSPQQSAAPTQGTSQTPQDHPPAEVMEQLAALQEQAEADPQDSQIRVAIGNAYYDMRRFDGAIPWYEEALLLTPENVDIRTDLGTAYLYTGNPIKAVALYQQSLEVQPDHAQTLHNIGVTYLSIGNFPEALGSFEKLLEFHPDHPDFEAIEQQIEQIRETHPQGAPL